MCAKGLGAAAAHPWLLGLCRRVTQSKRCAQLLNAHTSVWAWWIFSDPSFTSVLNLQGTARIMFSTCSTTFKCISNHEEIVSDTNELVPSDVYRSFGHLGRQTIIFLMHKELCAQKALGHQGLTHGHSALGFRVLFTTTRTCWGCSHGESKAALLHDTLIHSQGGHARPLVASMPPSHVEMRPRQCT